MRLLVSKKVMSKITPIRTQRYNYLNVDITRFPKNNPFIVDSWEIKDKNLCRNEVYEKIKLISNFLSWVGYQQSMSSSDGNSHFRGSFALDGNYIKQELVYVHSVIISPDFNTIGFKYKISFVEWVENKGIINAGVIDDMVQYANDIITFNTMLNSELDKNIAIELLMNNLKGNK